MRKAEPIPPPCNTSELRMVDLSEEGLSFLPIFGHTHYTRAADEKSTNHVHTGIIEVLFSRGGEGLFCELNGEIVPFRPGDVFVAQPSDLHCLRTYPRKLDMLWFWFRIPRRGEDLPSLSAAETKEMVRRLRALPNRFAGTDALRRCFRDLWVRLDEPPRDTPGLRALRLRQAAYDLLLTLIDASTRPPEKDADVCIQRLIDEMSAEPGRAYPVVDLARRANLNAVAFHRRFKRITGVAPHAFLTNLRMRRARELLETTALSIAAIALRLGYPSAQHFATQFKAFTDGLTPRHIRARGSVTPQTCGGNKDSSTQTDLDLLRTSPQPPTT